MVRAKEIVVKATPAKLANNFSYTAIAENLNNISNAGMNNAYRIARTEGHRIQNQSALDVANKAKEKVWM